MTYTSTFSDTHKEYVCDVSSAFDCVEFEYVESTKDKKYLLCIY